MGRKRGLRGLAEPDLVFEDFGLRDHDVGIDGVLRDEADDFGAGDLDAEKV